MLTDRYLASVKNIGAIFDQIVKGTAPQVFNVEHLASVGFGSSTDRAIVPLLKTLGFLSESGQPTPRYLDYRAGGATAKAVLGEALLEAYEDIFHINANPTEADREAIQGKFKSAHNTTDRVAEMQAMTFFALLKLADLDGGRKRKIPGSGPGILNTSGLSSNEKSGQSSAISQKPPGVGLIYNIQVHLPATKEIEVYNAIFKSLRENLID